MSLLLNLDQINAATGKFNDFFDTFSIGRNSYISVVKEPLQILNTNNNNILFGYGADNQNTSDISYVPQTGVFPAVILYGRNMNLDKFTSLKFQVDLNTVLAKVKEDCKDYIINGKTERIYAEGIPYVPQITPLIQNFFGLRFYYFKLNEVT